MKIRVIIGVCLMVFIFTLTYHFIFRSNRYLPYSPGKDAIEDTLRVVGSGVIENVLEKNHALFRRYFPHAKFKFFNTSSAYVPEALLGGDFKFATSSRQLDSAVKEKFYRKFGYPLIEIQLAWDAVVIIAHPANPISGLTLPQLDAIYGTERRAGALSNLENWSELGWTNQNSAIVIWGGGHNWGTTRWFKEIVLKNGIFKTSIRVNSIENGIPSQVSRDPVAIGYTSFQALNRFKIRALSLASQSGEPFIACTQETIYNQSYPLTRALYLYINASDKKQIDPHAREFIRFIFSKEGQQAVAGAGLLPLTLKQAQIEKGKLRFM